MGGGSEVVIPSNRPNIPKTMKWNNKVAFLGVGMEISLDHYMHHVKVFHIHIHKCNGPRWLKSKLYSYIRYNLKAQGG
jgi:hypothetical protein